MYIENGIKFTGKTPASPHTRSKRATAFLPYKIKYHEYHKLFTIIIIIIIILLLQMWVFSPH